MPVLGMQEPVGELHSTLLLFSDQVLAEELKGPMQEPPNGTTGDMQQEACMSCTHLLTLTLAPRSPQ